MEFDTIHFKLTDNLQPGRKFPKYGWVERRNRATPEPLYVLCARICDYLPEEPCFKWTNMHVLMWIEALGFPQYRVGARGMHLIAGYYVYWIGLYCI